MVQTATLPLMLKQLRLSSIARELLSNLVYGDQFVVGSGGVP